MADIPTKTKKRGFSSSADSSNLEEIEHLIQTNNFIYSDEECDNNIDDFLNNENITIPCKLINKCCSESDDDTKNPNKKSKKDNDKNNKVPKNDNPSRIPRTSRTNQADKHNRRNNEDTERSERSERSETSRPYFNNWRNKKTRVDPQQEDEWNDYLNSLLTHNATIPCENPICDHISHPDTWYDEHKITITNVNTLDDLIFLGSFYHCKMRTEYNEIDMKVLYNIKDALIELNIMIGLGKIKEEIVNTIIYFLLTKNLSKEINSDMMHAVITGSPGSGKTTFIEILAKIYVGLGVLKKGHIIKTRRSELIGKYLGHTAIQTQKKIEEAYGGILLIDEAYALGNPEGRDSFAKECLDTLNQALSENKNDFICIIAGYKDALDTSFFKYNDGLKRRFPFRYDIDKYTSDELSMILYKKIEEYGHYGIHKVSIWTPEFTKIQLQKLIKENFNNFQNQGGDMESIFLGAKIAQNKRVFLLEKEEKKKLLLTDIKTSITKFIELHKLKDNRDDYILRTMYI
jgi:hypothetical protein